MCQRLRADLVTPRHRPSRRSAGHRGRDPQGLCKIHRRRPPPRKIPAGTSAASLTSRCVSVGPPGREPLSTPAGQEKARARGDTTAPACLPGGRESRSAATAAVKKPNKPLRKPGACPGDASPSFPKCCGAVTAAVNNRPPGPLRTPMQSCLTALGGSRPLAQLPGCSGPSMFRPHVSALRVVGPPIDLAIEDADRAASSASGWTESPNGR